MGFLLQFFYESLVGLLLTHQLSPNPPVVHLRLLHLLGDRKHLVLDVGIGMEMFLDQGLGVLEVLLEGPLGGVGVDALLGRHVRVLAMVSLSENIHLPDILIGNIGDPEMAGGGRSSGLLEFIIGWGEFFRFLDLFEGGVHL